MKHLFSVQGAKGHPWWWCVGEVFFFLSFRRLRGEAAFFLFFRPVIFWSKCSKKERETRRRRKLFLLIFWLSKRTARAWIVNHGSCHVRANQKKLNRFFFFFSSFFRRGFKDEKEEHQRDGPSDEVPTTGPSFFRCIYSRRKSRSKCWSLDAFVSSPITCRIIFLLS